MATGIGERRRGRPIVYSERLIVKALVIMIIRRLYTAYSLLAFMQQDTDLTCQLRELLTEKQGSFPRDGHGNAGWQSCPVDCLVSSDAWAVIL